MESKGKTALPDGFEVTQEMRTWAKFNAAGVNVDAVTAEFIDYCRARDWRMKDWQATWRNWVRKSVKSSAGRSFHAAPATPVAAPPAKPVAPKTFPQACPHRATLNLSMLAVVLALGGRVPLDNLRNAVRERNRLADELRSMYGTSEVPAEEWADLRPGYRRRFHDVLTGAA
jgi:hypothetical protein